MPACNPSLSALALHPVRPAAPFLSHVLLHDILGPEGKSVGNLLCARVEKQVGAKLLQPAPWEAGSLSKGPGGRRER